MTWPATWRTLAHARCAWWRQRQKDQRSELSVLYLFCAKYLAPDCRQKLRHLSLLHPNHRLRIHRCATRYTSHMISLSHELRHFHTHFWQVHSFEFQYKCITEKCILPFYKRPGQKHNFICCLKCTGQLSFINICEPR